MRFVKPDVVRIALGEGADWIEVRKELSVGEDKRYRTKGLRAMTGIGGDVKKEDVKVDVEWEQLPFARVCAYLVNWSADREVTPKAIEALASEDFEVIDKAILAYIDKATEEKKARTTAATPPTP